MLLYVNAGVNKNGRTNYLARFLINKLGEDFKEVKLIDLTFPKVDNKFLAFRDECVKKSDFTSPVFDLAKQFLDADAIVIGAPFWDLSFPSILKAYLEQVCVTNLTFKYTEDGKIIGLCKAKKLYYVTTSGGPMIEDFGYNYVKSLAQNFFGIDKTFLLKAEFLDVYGANVNEILAKAENEITKLLLET